MEPYTFYGTMKGMSKLLKDYCVPFFGVKSSNNDSSYAVCDGFKRNDETCIVLCTYMCKGRYFNDKLGSHPKEHYGKALIVTLSELLNSTSSLAPKVMVLPQLFDYPKFDAIELIKELGQPTLLLTRIIRACSIKLGSSQRLRTFLLNHYYL